MGKERIDIRLVTHVAVTSVLFSDVEQMNRGGEKGKKGKRKEIYSLPQRYTQNQTLLLLPLSPYIIKSKNNLSELIEFSRSGKYLLSILLN
jgi:hypothetical protein